MNNLTEATARELDLGHSVMVRHLPHFVRFSASVSISGTGKVMRTYNPPSLSSLSTSVVVANSSPDKIQRYV